MTPLLRRPARLAVDVPAAVRAGEPLAVTVRAADGRPVPGGTVELVRDTALTRTRRQRGGAATAVAERATAVVARADLDAAGRTLLAVPDGEATVAAYLVQRDHTVRALARTASGDDGEGSAAVRVTSCGAPDRAGGARPEVTGADAVDLVSTELSGHDLHPGTVLTGTVVATARTTLALRGVRVELVLAERVPARPGEQVEEDRTATTAVATVPVAGAVRARPGEQLRWAFRVQAPDPLPAPSASTPEYTLQWLLRAVADRPLRRDPSVTVELRGATAS
ncbi:hypothetical protein [Geodermatophilus sp. SYSU D00710]